MENAVPPKIYEILKKVVNGDIDKFIVQVHDANKKGEGYLGQMFFVSLRDRDNGKQLNFVVKQAFSEQNIREFQPIREVFLNEIYFYNKLWPKLSKFQERVPPKYHFDHLAKCFGAISEENCERLVFENLKFKGFVIHEKKIPLTKEMFQSIFKLYGRFHAASFAFKALHPEEFSEMAGQLVDVWDTFTKQKNFMDAIKMTHELCLDNLQKGVDDAIIENYRRYVDDGVEIFRDSLGHGNYTTIIHGDCWSNNMMFKYDEFGNIADIKFLDFQLIRLGSPVCDLSYCLYSGGTKEVFDDLDKLLQVYHDSLSECLREYGCEPDQIYPLEALKNDWKVHCQLGITMGLMIWRTKMTFDEDALDLTDISDDTQVDMKKFFDTNYDQKTFRKRVKDILVHLHENNYLYA